MGRPVVAAFLLGLLTLSAASAQPPARHHKDLKFPPLNPLNVPTPTRIELSNGMVVYLVEDRELPLVTASALIRTGSRWEPAAKTGLASMTGAVMRTGGTAERPGDALDDLLDRLGAVVEIGIGENSGGATVSVLKEDVDQGLTILADLLRHPAFPPDKIELEKIQQRDTISRRNDDPADIAFREFSRVVYGKDSPYARQTEYASIDSITREDLVAFHREFFQPENVILGVWGDFETTEMRKKIETRFAGWARGRRPRPPVPAANPAATRPGLYAISKEDVNQSWVVMGFLNGRRDDPDYYALSVLNRILGGGFSSRLFNNVRAKEGLAYSVFSQWNAGWDHAGTFLAGGSSKSETTLEILEAIKREIARFGEGEVAAEELSLAKDTLLKGYVFEFDSTGEVVRRLMTYEYYGYPRDYLQRFRDNIEKVTAADVLRVARKHLETKKLAILVLGQEKDFGRPLRSLGPVTPIDISIPPPSH
jgi:zinc protease